MKKIIILSICMFYWLIGIAQSTNKYYFSEYEKSDNPNFHISKYVNENIYYINTMQNGDLLESAHQHEKEYRFILLGYHFDKIHKKITHNLDTLPIKTILVEKDSILEYRSYNNSNEKKELVKIEFYPKYMGQTHSYCPLEGQELKSEIETCYYITYQKDTVFSIGVQKILCAKYIKWDGYGYKENFREFTYFSKQNNIIVQQTIIKYNKDVEYYRKALQLHIIVKNITEKEKRFTDIIFNSNFINFIDALDKNKIRKYNSLKELYNAYKSESNVKMSFKNFKELFNYYCVLEHRTLLLYKFVLPEFDYKEDKIISSFFE